MPDLVATALSATRESKHIEFKESFDPTSAGGWCELIKDLVAIANSGGGIIVFGLNSQGESSGAPIKSICAVDPADITNRIFKYTGCADLDVEIREVEKCGTLLCAFLIPAVSMPLVFARPGTYDAGGGKQKTAFGMGTVYFRHGSKSEPGTTEDLRFVISRRLDLLRKDWAKGIRKVVQAPVGSEVLIVQRTTRGRQTPTGNVRPTKDPDALPVILTRDINRRDGIFLHEELSDGIFDEINNVVDANFVLAKGHRLRFVLGLDIYYRIYAERQHVDQRRGQATVLLHSAITELYAPALFWLQHASKEDIGGAYSELFLRPRHPQIHALLRLAVLLGDDFCKWLFGKWNAKWENHSQPPTFFWTFQEMYDDSKKTDYRAVAAKLGLSKVFEFYGEKPVPLSELLDKVAVGSGLLSRTCLRVFEGQQDQRSVARNLDYIVYGQWVREHSLDISEAIIASIGNTGPGDVANTAAE